LRRVGAIAAAALALAACGRLDQASPTLAPAPTSTPMPTVTATVTPTVMPATESTQPRYSFRPYALEVEDAGNCRFVWGATNAIGDERFNYACDTGLWGLGGPYRSRGGEIVIDTAYGPAANPTPSGPRQVAAMSTLSLDDPRCIKLSGIAQAQCIDSLFQEDPTMVPLIEPTVVPTATATPTSTSLPEVVRPIIPYPEPVSTPVPHVYSVPTYPGYKSQAPYNLVPMHSGHDKEMQIVLKAAQQWNDLTGLDLFDNSSSNIVPVMFEGDADNGCPNLISGQNIQTNGFMAAYPGTVTKPYTAFVWLCVREFVLDGCTATQHELGHVLGLADNQTSGSTGVMSYWEGRYPGDGGISYDQWCHNPILPKEAEAVRELNSTNQRTPTPTRQ